jgi:hypothetical protein
MPYRIKARNQAGNTVTRWDMKGGAGPRNLKEAEAIAKEFAETRGAYGPWTGFVEYYNSDDSINSTGNPRSTDHLTAKPRPGMVNVKLK